MAGETFDYYAFISYSHSDKAIAQKLQKRLERYHMPAKLLEDHPELPKKIAPIFRDESDLTGRGTLIETLYDNLRRSQYLILICSPGSAKSPYVNAEVDYFINTLHRADRIIPLIVEGLPHSKDPTIECFPKAILDLPTELEPLGIDLKTFGKRDAFLRVIATLLRLNFTYFKPREDEERKKRLKIFASMAVVFAVIVGALVWYNLDFLDQVFNSVSSQYHLGVMYQEKQDYAKAMEWYQKAAAQGNPNAQNNIGYMYLHGLGVKQDYAKAMEWYKKAAAQGLDSAQTNIGYMYRYGLGVKQDYAKAFEWYEKAAAQGQAEAQDNIAHMYYYGYGVRQDYAKAMEWHKKAAAQGLASAQNSIGTMYFYGLGVEQDHVKAMEWYEKAALNNNAEAQYNLGEIYYHIKQDYAKALEWYRKASAQGNSLAQHSIGYMYQNGLGVKQDYAKAMEFYRKAAAHENRTAQYNIGYMYLVGLGVKQDYTKAAEWFEKSASNGDAQAQNNLGLMYDIGLGVPESRDKAIEYFTQAAKQGHEEAKSLLQKLSQQDK